jgi:DNA repair protein RecN (Recombination protein N)
MGVWLESVHITNLGLMRELTLTLEPGLTAITGESGSGKSMVLTAIDAALGARVSAEQVGRFGDRARVRLAFQVDPAAAWWAELADWDIAADHLLVVQREWGKDGRSSLRIQGQPVPVSVARNALADLVDLAGQHEHQQLLAPDHARRYLDQRVDPKVRDAVKAAWQAWAAVREQQERVAALLGDPRRVAEVREAAAALRQLGPEAGEEERLHQQVARWSQAERIARGLRALLDILEGTAEGPALAQLLRDAERGAAEVARLDPEGAGEWPGRLAGAREAADEVIREAYRLGERLEYDPVEARRIAERLDELARAARRFGVKADELPDVLARLQAEMAELDDAEWTLGRLAEEARAAEAAFRSAADALRAARRQAADELLPAVGALLPRLDLPHARLELAWSEGPPGPNGVDRLEWRFASHRSQEPRPLSRVASGGELARVALALRAVEPAAAILLLDEVDSGLGGQAARQVADLLGELARTVQVVVVSHQPVVAGAAAYHWRIVRTDDAESTEVAARPLEGDERVHELARMLTGRADAASVAHARQLLTAEQDG